jgi:hypothetical protein
MPNGERSRSVQLFELVSIVLICCVAVVYSIGWHDSIFLIAMVTLLVISLAILVLFLLATRR